MTVGDEWAVVNAIGDGDAARALREAGARLDRGDSPHALVGQLRWWVSNRLAEGAPNRVRAGARRAAPNGSGAEKFRRRRARPGRETGRRAHRPAGAETWLEVNRLLEALGEP